jgi:D-aminopeptidase
MNGVAVPVDVECDADRLDALFRDIDQCHLPGAAVGVAVGGRPVYRRSFGLAHQELPVALTSSTRMRIGSITKHFTCLAYLLLCEESKAGLEDPLGRYLPELNTVAHAVTVRQLMAHTSGLRDVHDICWQFSGTGHKVTSAQLLSLYRGIDDVNAAPGTRWLYNNGGFLLLSEVIQRIADRSLEEVLRQRVFEPAGMPDTLLRRGDDDFLPNSATLHMTRSQGGFEKSYLGTALAGEGGVVSTVDDLLRWFARPDMPPVGSSTTWHAIRAPQRLVNGASTDYGLGLRLGSFRGMATLGHAGGVMGGQALMLKVPSAGLDVVVLVNRHDLSAINLAERILVACIPSLDSSAALSDRPFSVGAFGSQLRDRVVQLFAREGKQIAAIDGVDVEVAADGAGVMRPTGVYGHLKWEIAPSGDAQRPSAIRLTDFGETDELTPLQTALPSTPEAMTGRYRGETPKIDLTISSTNQGLRLHSAGWFGFADYELTLLGERVCRARSLSSMPWSGILSFDDSYQTLRFTTARTAGLTFRRLS